MIRVPLDEPTMLHKGIGYSIELRRSRAVEGSAYVASVRPWQATDVEPPILVATDQLVTEVNLRSIPV